MSKNIPRTVIRELPSHFKAYPSGLTISIRPYTLGENMRLSSEELPLIESVHMVMKGIYVEGSSESFKRTRITLDDFLYLSLLRKILSRGSEGGVTLSTTRDGVKYSRTIKYTEVKFREMQIDKVPIRVDLGGREVTFFPFTIYHFLTLHTLLPDRVEDEIAIFATQMVEDDGKDDKDRVRAEILANIDFLENLPNSDLEVLLEVEKCYDHGVENITLQNSEGKEGSGKPVEIEIGLNSLDLDFFRPEDPSRVSVRDRLRFG